MYFTFFFEAFYRAQRAPPRKTIDIHSVTGKYRLLVFIDGATGRLMHLHFYETESAFDYIVSTWEYIDKYGNNLAFYSDKHAVFRISQAENGRVGTKKFGRALHDDLNIGLIYANSSQAKIRGEKNTKDHSLFYRILRKSV